MCWHSDWTVQTLVMCPPAEHCELKVFNFPAGPDQRADQSSIEIKGLKPEKAELCTIHGVQYMHDFSQQSAKVITATIIRSGTPAW